MSGAGGLGRIALLWPKLLILATGVRRIAFFCLKFTVFLSVLLFLWWWKVQPQYVGLIGRITSAILRYIASVPIEAMIIEIDPAGVMSTKTILVWVIEGRQYPFDVSYLVANIPPYFALVLATPGLAIKRLLKVLLIGLAILAAGHILFLVLAFVFSAQIQKSPELPTAIGLFLMTMPFVLWIALAYWDKVKLLLEETMDT